MWNAGLLVLLQYLSSRNSNSVNSKMQWLISSGGRCHYTVFTYSQGMSTHGYNFNILSESRKPIVLTTIFYETNNKSVNKP